MLIKRAITMIAVACIILFVIIVKVSLSIYKEKESTTCLLKLLYGKVVGFFNSDIIKPENKAVEGVKVAEQKDNEKSIEADGVKNMEQGILNPLVRKRKIDNDYKNNTTTPLNEYTLLIENTKSEIDQTSVNSQNSKAIGENKIKYPKRNLLGDLNDLIDLNPCVSEEVKHPENQTQQSYFMPIMNQEAKYFVPVYSTPSMSTPLIPLPTTAKNDQNRIVEVNEDTEINTKKCKGLVENQNGLNHKGLAIGTPFLCCNRPFDSSIFQNRDTPFHCVTSTQRNDSEPVQNTKKAKKQMFDFDINPFDYTTNTSSKQKPDTERTDYTSRTDEKYGSKKLEQMRNSNVKYDPIFENEDREILRDILELIKTTKQKNKENMMTNFENMYQDKNTKKCKNSKNGDLGYSSF
ncbi:hypothetical protein SLOPH_1017 [Spraguea lophii 42_110]|uniref:Uncharacterized protein n=1 Tax=Spraguea lophii (strain 42_110) TaxID=1358809 RepID=S7W7E2_SPRLO|nr:hypothetical protein SLOPH_1017 [Spraguea lophii 42_110]